MRGEISGKKKSQPPEQKTLSSLFPFSSVIFSQMLFSHMTLSRKVQILISSLARLTCSCRVCGKPLPDGHTQLWHSSACPVCVHRRVCLRLHLPPWLLRRWACLWGWVATFTVGAFILFTAQLGWSLLSSCHDLLVISSGKFHSLSPSGRIFY